MKRNEDINAARRQAVAMHEQGIPVHEIVHKLGYGRSTIHGWLQTFRQGGMGNLLSRGKPGQRAKLTEEQRKELEQTVACLSFEDFPRKPRTTMLQAMIRVRFDQDVSPLWIARFLRSTGTSMKELRKRYHAKYIWLTREKLGTA